MTPQERDMLTAFLQQLAQTQAGAKDAEAERLINEVVVKQPDAAYLLVQRAMGLDLAFQAAQARITALEAEVERFKVPAPQQSTGFLSSLTGWGRSGGQREQLQCERQHLAREQPGLCAVHASSTRAERGVPS